ncbi:MAG TPA: AsmA family protein [Alphaproteobacteria bacterium]|nr:AsmA family protein [Alphaproteobacteria bacterium]
MRTFFTALGITGVLIVTALLVAPSVVDWNSYRGALSEELSRATGRTVSLNGPIEASFLPAPRILANDVRLSADAPAKRAGDGEDFLRLRAVELRVGLLPLLTGHIVVERLTLVRPEFLVETEKDGRLHWVLDGAGGDLLPAVDLQRLAISDGTLVWRDRRNNAQTRIENIFLSLAAGSLSGPAKAQGTARLGDVPVKFTASVGAFHKKAAVPLNISAEMSSLKSKAEFAGQLTPADGRVTGRLKASGSDGRALIAGLAGGPAASGVGPALLAHRFAVDARVSAAVDSIEANDVVLDLADQHATGTVRAHIPDSGATVVDVALRAPRLNLDSLATVPPIASGGSSALPRDIKLGMTLQADAVLAAGRAVQGFAVDAALDQGRVEVKRLEGQLPGAGSVRLSGVVAPEGNSYRFDGAVETAAANLRDLLSWLDVDTSTVPGGRLGRATLKAKVSADRDSAELKDVDLHIDSTRAHGSLRVDYRDKPTLALDLAADQLDADAYLGDSDAGGASAVPPALADLAGEARLSIGQLTYRDVDMRDVDLTAAIDGGDVNVSYFSGGPPEIEKMFGQKDAAPAVAEDPRTDSRAPIVAVQAPALALDSGAMAIPAPPPPAKDPAPEARPDPAPEPAEPSRDDFVRDLLGRLAR